MMGRLFWKFFLFLFIAQLVTALAVGAFIQFRANTQAAQGQVDLSPLSQGLIDAAEIAFSLGGVDALKTLLQRWEAERIRHRVYVIDDHKRDILNRKIDTDLINQAIESEASMFENTVTKVSDQNGQSYWVFVVFNRFESHRSGPRERRGPPERGLRPPPPPNDVYRPDPPREQFASPRPEGYRPLIDVVRTFPLKALLIAALASALFAVILAWYFSKPIGHLRAAFKQAADGDLNVRVSEKMGSRHDELSDLGQHFDFMASRLNALLQGQKRLLHHVSHELRSPLARLHMALGLARQDAAKTDASLSRIEQEADRMDKLIGELLELSRFESGMVDLAKEQFSLNELMETIVKDAEFEAEAKQVKIDMTLMPSLQLEGQIDLIHRAIENVVRNAVKYTPDHSTIYIASQLDQAKKEIALTVSDQGSGVLETELEDIFKPFVRGHSGSQVKGHGVGLAIAKQVVEAHDGSIQASNLKPYGFCIKIVLPTVV